MKETEFIASVVSRRLLPVAASAPISERAFRQELEIEKLHLLLETACELGTEITLERLMALIVGRTSRMLGCERSSVFLLDQTGEYIYALVAQGLDTQEIRVPTAKGLAGHVARTGEAVNVSDAYSDSRFNPDVDKATGFRTRAVLALPLFGRKNQVLGVIQCLNRIGPDGKPSIFSQEDERLLAAMAGLAAVFLENGRLYADMDKLLEAVVGAFSQSIDDRDPSTSGHSLRVTLYTLNLARAVHDSKTPPFDEIQYSRERMKRLRYATLLHDVGKIGVRERVLCKGPKLTAEQLEAVRARLELLGVRRRADALERAVREKLDADALLKNDVEPLVKDLEAARALIEAKVMPGWVTDVELAALKALREKSWLTQSEFEHLSIRRGNLTPSEWEDMKAHVTKSFEMLRRIPWPTELRELPAIAHAHHEKLDGTGYPLGLKQKEIPFDAQVMMVADIYDALTAGDRTYKKAFTFEDAKRILSDEEAARGKIMPELVALFFEKQCYKLPENAPRRNTQVRE